MKNYYWKLITWDSDNKLNYWKHWKQDLKWTYIYSTYHILYISKNMWYKKGNDKIYDLQDIAKSHGCTNKHQAVQYFYDKVHITQQW